MFRSSLAFSLLFLAVGCKPPPEAPTELDELSAYLFSNWETAEEGVLEVGMFNMQQHFAALDLDVDYQDRSYQLTNLTGDEIDGVSAPEGSDPADCLGVGLVTGSAFAPEEHAVAIIQADQTAIEPNSRDKYDRIFLDPTDPTCFPSRDCAVLRTNNDLIKKNALMEIPYEMIKDFRWVELSEDGEPGTDSWGILARTWIEEAGIGESGNNTIEQSYSIDVFLPGAHGGFGAYRYMGLWSESTGTVDDPETIMNVTIWGMDDLFDETEKWLEENL
jgi:hypothetical protein